ncbi:MAG: hydroxymethylbilane synthase [Gammaproteobacteria bacterium]|nr:hydroxymethylbilane synthase [Gammaproteobacteria bacterium]MCD8524955.1 hydroxymethylbilane synthase [Gammaproteobacteria bacterium]MCD8542300.1 hydroxymethylbilane synthase [Gammaproteobacteria bacterium]
MRNDIRIATRQSPLALWQAEAVKAQLLHHSPELRVTLVPLVTHGDIILDRSLSKVGGKGLFVKELEHALFEGNADIAVHSMKDVPMHLPDGLAIAAILSRGSVEDVFVSQHYTSLKDMPAGARVGTSSARRKLLLQKNYPHIECVDVRGNVATRLDKCFSGHVDGLILAAAGLERLNLSNHIQEYLHPDDWLPAPGQGAIGVELRSDDTELKNLIGRLNHQESWETVTAERAISRALNGGCGVPLAAYAVIEDNRLWLRAWWENPTTGQYLFSQAKGSRDFPDIFGEKVAENLRSGR